MKKPSLIKILTGTASALLTVTLTAGAGGDHHDDHNHPHDEHHAHAEDAIRGRVIHSVEPHLVFFVNAERKAEISALNDAGKKAPITDQKVRLVGGDRSNPTRMNFTAHEQRLISDIAFPPGNGFPIVLMITPSPGAKMVIEKFNLNLDRCPTCSFQEYACICVHDDHHHHEEHNHGEHKGHDH